MYQHFYGLRELPFELTPNPRYLYLTAGHREALANLQYGLSTAKPITVLVGEAGTGKTTLIGAALASEACRQVRCLHLTNPNLTRNEFVEMLARGFSMSSAAARSKATLLAELEDLLLERRAKGEVMALVVDEAQRMNDELLEEVRLLANIETPTEKLLPLVLAGQPELSDRLNEVGLRQLKQRVALRCEIAPLTLDETAAFMAWRIRTAGGDAARLFTREAVTLIHELSHGIPRTISVLCDNALLGGFAAGRRPVGRDLVSEVATDFDLRARDLGERAHRPAAAAPASVLPAAPVKVDEMVSADPERLESPAARQLFADAGRRRRFSLFG